jgi:glucosylceramidase
MHAYPEKYLFHNVTIDSSTGGRQELLGFGHSWTDSAVSLFDSLEPNLFKLVTQELFGQEGNNMGFMRHTVGSSDLSDMHYTYDDNGPDVNQGQPDPSLANFSLGAYGEHMADMIADMGQYKSDVTLCGSPWSAPGWMKKNGLLVAPVRWSDDGTNNVENNSFNPAHTEHFAQYLAKYVDAFRARGVRVNAISPMNEPLNYQGGYPCMLLRAEDEVNLINGALGTLMRERDVDIWAFDHNTDATDYPYQVLESAHDNVQAIAWHCYALPGSDYSVMADFRRDYPDIPQFMTECANYKPQPGTWNFQVAKSFMLSIANGASGATMWVMATDPYYGPHTPLAGCDGCLGSIIVNSPSSYTKTNDYYMIGQFSRFIRRAAINFAISDGGNEGEYFSDRQFYAIATQNLDGSWVVVFMNNYGRDQNVVLQFTGNEDFLWQGVIPNGTVVTWLLPSATGGSVLRRIGSQLKRMVAFRTIWVFLLLIIFIFTGWKFCLRSGEYFLMDIH